MGMGDQLEDFIPGLNTFGIDTSLDASFGKVDGTGWSTAGSTYKLTPVISGFSANRSVTFPDRDITLEGAVIADPGDAAAIPVTNSGTCAITTAGAETRTIAVPTFVGQWLMLTMDVDGGNAVVTVASPLNATGNNTITFANAGESVYVVAGDVGGTPLWRIVGSDFGAGGGLSTV